MVTRKQEPLATAEDVVGVYRVFLRRDPESDHAVAQNVDRPLADLIRICMGSEEFDRNTVAPVLAGTSSGASLEPPTIEAVEWAKARLPLGQTTRKRVASATTWLMMYKALFDDRAFVGAVGKETFFGPVEALRALDEASQFQGEVSGSDGRIVSGWARWTDNRGPVSLELWSEGERIGQGLATLFDRGLEQRFPGSGDCAFRIALPTATADIAFKAEVREASTGRLVGEIEVHQSRFDHGVVGDWNQRLSQLGEEISALRSALPSVLTQSATSLERYDEHYRLWLASPFAAPPYSGGAVAVVLDGAAASTVQIEAAARTILNQSLPRISLHIVAGDADRALLEDAARRMMQTEGVQVEVVASTSPDPLSLLDADFIHLMDARTVAHSDLLAAAAQTLDDHPRLRAVYFDEDALEAEEDEARRISPRFKPDFDGDLLLQQPFIGASLTMRREAWALLAGKLDFGDSSPSAAALILDAEGARIGHEALVLQSLQAGASLGGIEAWGRVVADHLEARGSAARPVAEPDILSAPSTHRHRIRWPLPPGRRASVIIPTRDRLDLLQPCLESLFRFEGQNQTSMEVIIVDHQSEEMATQAYLANLVARRPETRIVPFDQAFNWALMNNLAAAEATGDVLIFLNNDTVAVSPDWLDELASQSLRSEVGVVGARLIYPDGTLQHGGFVAANHRESFLGHEGLGVSGRDGGYLGRHAVVRQTTAVTGACMAISAAKFAAIGGFEAAAFPVDGNDVDLCFRARTHGWRVLYTPYSTFYHLESKTRGFGLNEAQHQAARAAVDRLWKRWGEAFGQDPFYNRNFDRLAEPFTRLGPPLAL